MRPNLAKRLVCACLLLLQLLINSTVFAKSGGGAIAGGGGDSSEARVDEIRADILKWINNGGAKDLILPESIPYSDYETKMKEILKPQKVVLGFIEQDDKTNNELQVSVDGRPKTCRGFISEIDQKYHMLCNISRFSNTTEADQYRLIHHEFAGLVNIENNDEAASDYSVSSQITEFLSMQTVLKLAVKSQIVSNSGKVQFLVKKRKYIGKSKYEVEITIADTTNIHQVILNNVNSDNPNVQKIILNKNNDFTLKTIVEPEFLYLDFDVRFHYVTVQYIDGSVMALPDIRYNIPSALKIEDIENKENTIAKKVINYKIISDVPTEKQSFSYVSLKTFKTKYEVSFDSTKVDLSDVRGIVIYKNNLLLEEFFSEDAKELEGFLKNKVIAGETNYKQRVKYSGLGCGEVNYYDPSMNESYSCKPLFLSKSKYYGKDKSMDFIVKFIKKGNITKLQFSTLRIPDLHPDKEANDYEKEYDMYWSYKQRDRVYELEKPQE